MTRPRLLTWSTRELAELAGTTVKAVRYYHAAGLLDQPERAPNGYKRYRLEHLVKVIRIRRLVELGVPAAQIGELEASSARSEEVLRDLDAEFTAAIERLERARADLRRLRRHGAAVYAPPLLAGALPPGAASSRAAVLTVAAAVLSAEVLPAYAALADADQMLDEALAALPADASDTHVEALAQRIAPSVRRAHAQHAWLAHPFADSPRGDRAAEETLGAVLAELFHPAQLRVMTRVAELADREDGRAGRHAEV